MSSKPDVLVIVPQGLPDIAAHHEATSGIGALDPAPSPFLYPPHTAAQCVAGLRVAGLSAEVLDAWGSRRSLAEMLAEISSSEASVLAVQVSHGTEHADETFLGLLKHTVLRDKPWRRVLLFGVSARFVAEPWLQTGLADAALVGEPEKAIVPAVEAVAAGRAAGMLAAHELCRDAYTPDNLLRDLDVLPFPAWDSVPWQAYDDMVSLLSSRGCPDRCVYCAYVLAQGHRSRSQTVARTLAEWEWLARAVRPSYLMVRDPVFARDRGRLMALCEGIIARGIALRWGCESRPEHFDPELLTLMRAAGCEDVKIGLESSDPGLLAALGRVADPALADAYLRQVETLAKACRRLGIICRVFVMAGLPGQDSGSVAHTAHFLQRLGDHVVVHALPYQAHPGTQLPGPSASVPSDTLASLQAAPRARGASWRRVREAVAPLIRALRSAWRRWQDEKGRRNLARSLPVGLRSVASSGVRILRPDAHAEVGATVDEDPCSDGLGRPAQPQATGVATTKEAIFRPDAHVEVGAGVDEKAHRTRAFRRFLRSHGQPAKASSPDRRSGIFRADNRVSPQSSEQFHGTRVFLTGGNGFVGGHVAAALVASGATVVALVRPGSALGELADLPAGSVELVQGDLLREPDDWKSALDDCRFCFHLAALYAGPEQAEEMYQVNVRGTNRLLAACAEAGVERVVHTSTVGCVGRPNDPGVLPDESVRFNLWHSASHYVRSKYLGELVARAWVAAGLSVVVVQPTAPVGRGDARPTATGARILAALRGESFPYPPGGVNHVPVQDVAAGHLLAALHGIPGERYILGHCQGNLDHAAFLRMVASAAGRSSPATPRPAEQAGQMPQALTVNPIRAVRELGMPQSDLQEAFAAAIAWFQTHR